MRFIRDLYAEHAAARRPVISFEFFTPKTEEGERTLVRKTLPALLAAGPQYASVTYGAGGSTRDKTLDLVDLIQREFHLPGMAHLTCVGHTREHLGDVLADALSRGIQNILALRGDPPAGSGPFRRTEGGFEFAYELVQYLRPSGRFSIGVAGFPEGHLACREGRHVDWDRLKAKIACGADFVITQLFFDNRDFFAFRDYLTRAGVAVPIVPGMIAVLSASQIAKFTALCGATVPPPLAAALARLATDDEAALQYGIEYATRQCQELLEQGVPGLHFYTMNRSRSTLAILRNLGLAEPQP